MLFFSFYSIAISSAKIHEVPPAPKCQLGHFPIVFAVILTYLTFVALKLFAKT
jgi:hypothetical protein